MSAPVYEPEPDFLGTAFGLDGVPDDARLTVADALRAAYISGAEACKREVIQSLRGQARSAGGDHHQAALAYAASGFEGRVFPTWIHQRPIEPEPGTRRTTGEAWHRGKQRGVAVERGRVLAWMRAYMYSQPWITGEETGEIIDAIERGDHEAKQ